VRSVCQYLRFTPSRLVPAPFADLGQKVEVKGPPNVTSRAKILQPVSGRAVTETRHCLFAEVLHSPDPLRAAESC
jgi:hypothetical protein